MTRTNMCSVLTCVYIGTAVLLVCDVLSEHAGCWHEHARAGVSVRVFACECLGSVKAAGLLLVRPGLR